MALPLLLVLLAAGLSLAMALAWAIAKEPGRSGWTDAIWSWAIGIAGAAAALVPIDAGAPQPRQWLVAALVAGWALRLGGHIAARASKGHDDPRYAELRRQWQGGFAAKLFGFLQIQALAGWLLVLSVLLAARNPAPGLVWSDIAGTGLLLLALIGETIADRQLKAFTHHPANRRRVCDSGLWSLSRHPNYVCEWLGWCAYALIAIGPLGDWRWGWLALSGPALIYWLLVHVSGIPPLEAHMLRSRGEAFRAVQRRIPAFWPFLQPKDLPS
jgi:steroid 5-alpha reductase family enzyme